MSTLCLLQNQANAITTAAQLADRFRRQPSSPVAFPATELRALAEAGLLSIALPRDLGGLGIGHEAGSRTTLLLVLKEIGRANLPLGRLFEGHVNALLLLQQFGSSPQMADAAHQVLQHGSVFGVWNTGPAGSPQLTPGLDGTHFLSGSKTFATGAARIQKAIVTAAMPDGGWQMCFVPLTEKGFSVNSETWNPLGMEASESFAVEFSRIPLPPSALLGRPGDYYAEPTFTSGAFRFCAVQLGGAQALFDDCCELVRSSLLPDNSFQKQRLGQMAVLLESGRQWLTQAGTALEGSFTDGPPLAAQAHMMRIATEEICTRVIQLAQLTAGARGLAAAEPFARTLRDLQMYLRQAGFDRAFQEVADYALQERSAGE
jgi:alkylation response protein AidB-like acyl-CoA dehydrogenase